MIRNFDKDVQCFFLTQGANSFQISHKVPYSEKFKFSQTTNKHARKKINFVTRSRSLTTPPTISHMEIATLLGNSACTSMSKR